MGVPSYVCVTCGEHFTRKTSSKRHNLSIHNDNGQIVPILQYMAGISSGRYPASHPSLYRHGSGKNFGHATTSPAVVMVADSMRNTFRPGGMKGKGHRQRQYHPSLQQQQAASRQLSFLPSPSAGPTAQGVSLSPYPTATNHLMSYQTQPRPTKIGNNWGILSEETIPKFVELRMLLYRNPTTFSNPDIIVQNICSKHFCMMGDKSFLDEKLAYLRSVDAIRQQPGQDNVVV